MTIPTEVAAALAEMRELKVPNWPAGRILGDLADRLESALTKAEAVEPVAEVYEWHTCGRDALGEAYRQSKGVAMRFIGPALPIGTKLYAHAAPAVPVESQQADAKDATRFRWLRDHAINTEGRKGSPWCVYGLDLGDCTPTFGAELVAFVDDAMANGIVCSPVPVESMGRDAEPAGGLDAAMRTNGLPAVSDALGYSRNFAAANPHLTQTTKDHITGLCDMLELASAHQTTPPTPPVASVPDGWLPIASAPKDQLICIWITNKPVNERQWGEQPEFWAYCYYDQICGEWRTTRPSGHLRSVPERYVTHWMPIPSEPTNQEGAAP